MGEQNYFCHKSGSKTEKGRDLGATNPTNDLKAF